jgi:hypothetical protein
METVVLLPYTLVGQQGSTRTTRQEHTGQPHTEP